MRPAAPLAATRLPIRLRAVAGAVPTGTASVADIGAGDGQLARHLAARGVRVVATERRPGPFARLRAALPGVDCRMGEGLEVLAPGEVEGAVVAGLGGRGIARILAASPGVVSELRWLVLQPQQHTEDLLRWLRSSGHTVASTAVVAQGRHSYRVLVVRLHERP